MEGRGFEPQRASFSSLFRVKFHLCHEPILVFWYTIIVMLQLAIDGLCDNFTLEIYPFGCQLYEKKVMGIQTGHHLRILENGMIVTYQQR